MTKRDYEKFAEVIYNSWRSVTEYTDEYEEMRIDVHNNAIEDLVMDLLPVFKSDNPNFNEGRFMEACGL